MFAIVAVNLSMPLYIRRDQKNNPILKVVDYGTSKVPTLTNNEDDVYIIGDLGSAITLARYMDNKCNPYIKFKVMRMTYHKLKSLNYNEDHE